MLVPHKASIVCTRRNDNGERCCRQHNVLQTLSQQSHVLKLNLLLCVISAGCQWWICQFWFIRLYVKCLAPASVNKTLSSFNSCKGGRPNNVPCFFFLKDCAGKLKGVFTDIFSVSLSQAVVPICLNATTIIPEPEKPFPSS